MKFEDCPIGTFLYEDELCVKTKYGFEAYIVSSGERFWGNAYTLDELRNIDVTPVDVNIVRRGRRNSDAERSTM